jgi:hypothetical protein
MAHTSDLFLIKGIGQLMELLFCTNLVAGMIASLWQALPKDKSAKFAISFFNQPIDFANPNNQFMEFLILLWH